MNSRLLLSFILAFAGVLHLLRPELFNPAIPFSWTKEINFIVGILELCLAITLWITKLRELAAKISALWFLVLIPVHIYVSLNEIPIFGISHPAFLWARTFFQPVLYFWALSLQDKGWIMSQRWSDIIFLHYEVDAQKLQQVTPFPLDIYEGKAIVSIVPFVMSRIRFPFLPSVPGLSRLLELNLRTYVRVNGVPAVYFFTLDSNHLPGVLIARWFFALPYRWVKLQFNKNKNYEFSSPKFELKAQIGEVLLPNDFDRWATERYALFTHRGSSSLCGIVEHPPWKLQTLNVVSLCDDFSSLLGKDLKAQAFRATAYAHQLDVRFRPFRKLEEK